MPLTDFQFSPVETNRLLIRSVAEKPVDLDDEPQMINAFFNSIPDDKANEAVANKEAVFKLLRNLTKSCKNSPASSGGEMNCIPCSLVIS